MLSFSKQFSAKYLFQLIKTSYDIVFSYFHLLLFKVEIQVLPVLCNGSVFYVTWNPLNVGQITRETQKLEVQVRSCCFLFCKQKWALLFIHEISRKLLISFKKGK